MRAIWVSVLIAICGTVGGQSLPAPSAATIVLSSGRVTAGKSIELTIEFDRPPSYSGLVYLNFYRSEQPNAGISASCVLPPNTRQCTASITPPPDLDAGSYKLTSGTFNISKEYPLKFNEVTLIVDSPTEPVVVPQASVATMTRTTKQLLATRSEEILQIRDKLMQSLSANANDTPENRSKLITALSQADAVVLRTRHEYGLLRTSSQPFPVVFDDLHVHLTALEIEIKALRTNALFPAAKLVTVQLKERPNRDKNGKVLGMYGTKFSSAIATLVVLKQAYEGLKRMSDTGLETFVVAVRSIPSGASIEYKLDGDSEYSHKSQPTDTQMELLIGFYTFRFHKANCVDTVQSIDSLSEDHPVLTGELVCR